MAATGEQYYLTKRHLLHAATIKTPLAMKNCVLAVGSTAVSASTWHHNSGLESGLIVRYTHIVYMLCNTTHSLFLPTGSYLRALNELDRVAEHLLFLSISISIHYLLSLTPFAQQSE